jgi:hypothetical protein
MIRHRTRYSRQPTTFSYPPRRRVTTRRTRNLMRPITCLRFSVESVNATSEIVAAWDIAETQRLIDHPAVRLLGATGRLY